MAPPRIVPLQGLPPVPWKNGGGQSRELLVWPESEGWRLRISVADIRRDGPFSSFSGVTRWFAVVAGQGVVLRFSDEERRLFVGSDPLRFDGSWSPACRLVDGPTSDLNLMICGGRGTMATVRPGKSWADPFTHRGLFTRVAGRLVPESGEPTALPANSLLWQCEANPGAWRFEPDPGVPENATVAWWLGYSPEENRVSS